MVEHIAEIEAAPARLVRGGPRAIRCLGWALAGLAGCQSYEPRPLDATAHRAAWHGRTLEDASLRDFLARTERDLLDRPIEFEPDDGLSLPEGQLVALVFNPALRLARLRIGRAAATAEHAGLLDDPELSFSALYITESVSERWVISPGLAITVPLSGRLGAEHDRADAGLRAAQELAAEAEWGVWHEVRAAWSEWSAAQQRVEETERMLATLEGLMRTTSQLVESGELRRTEAALFSVELTHMEIELKHLMGEVAASEQALRAKLGLAPDAPLELVPALMYAGGPVSTLPGDSAGPGDPGDRSEASGARDEDRNPRLTRLRAEYEVAEESLRHEVLKQYPDLTLGPAYETDQGQSRIGFLGGLPLPFLNANRQAIAEARVEREIARAAYETEYESLVGRRAVVRARVEAVAGQRADIEETLVPLIDRQLEDALSLLQLGEGTSLVLLESLTRAHQIKLELIEARLAEALARAELEYLAGPLVAGPDGNQETP